MVWIFNSALLSNSRFLHLCKLLKMNCVDEIQMLLQGKGVALDANVFQMGLKITDNQEIDGCLDVIIFYEQRCDLGERFDYKIQ